MPDRDMRFTSGDVSLAGTLTLPPAAGIQNPGVVLISGSGPIDRDSNMKRQALEVMRDMAQHLASRGISSLRYDKRGVGESQGDYHSAGFWDNVADAEAAVDALRSEISPTSAFVVGHSEGALIAIRLAAAPASLDGVVLLAGSARSGRDILEHQAVIAGDSLPGLARLVLRMMRTDVRKLQAKRLARLDESTKDTTRIQGVKINSKWFREFMAHNPADDLPDIRVPLLAITGAKDLQVPPEDVARMKELVTASFESHIPDDLTHLLRLDPEDPTLKDYRRQIKEPTNAEVLETVSTWINRISADLAGGLNE